MYEEEKEIPKKSKKHESDDDEDDQEDNPETRKKKKTRNKKPSFQPPEETTEIFDEESLPRSQLPQRSVPKKSSPFEESKSYNRSAEEKPTREPFGHHKKPKHLPMIPENESEIHSATKKFAHKPQPKPTPQNEANQEQPAANQKSTHKIVLSLLAPKKEAEDCVFYQEFAIGSDSSADFLIKAFPDIADFHCEVSISPQGLFELRDCGSQFGTFLKLIPEQKYSLEEGQIYQFGRTCIRILGVDEDLEFEVIEGPQMNESFAVGKKKFTIGSKKNSDFEVKKDSWVSGEHCCIHKRSHGGFAIEDRGATNG